MFAEEVIGLHANTHTHNKSESCQHKRRTYEAVKKVINCLDMIKRFGRRWHGMLDEKNIIWTKYEDTKLVLNS